MYNPNTLKLIGSFGTCIIYSSAHNFYSTVTKINILKLDFYITNPILNIIQCYCDMPHSITLSSNLR